MQKFRWPALLSAVICAAVLLGPPRTAYAACDVTAPSTAAGVTQVAPGVYRVCLWPGFSFDLRVPFTSGAAPSQAVPSTPTSVCPVPGATTPPTSQFPAWQPPSSTGRNGASTCPTATQPGSASTPTDANYTQSGCSAQAQQMLNLVNNERGRAGRAPLSLDNQLCTIADLKSKDMFTRNYFDHTSPTYGSMANMLRMFNYTFVSCGENIAKHATIEKAHAAFMSSDGHRQNILSSSWQRMGIGIYNANGYVLVTQVFVR